MAYLLLLSQIVRGKRSITADTALRLARYFGASADVWMRLQARYDLESAEWPTSARPSSGCAASRASSR